MSQRTRSHSTDRTAATWQPVKWWRLRWWLWDAHVGCTGYRYGWTLTSTMAERKALAAVSNMVESGRHR
jgi:hypothetical protein